MSTKPSKSPQCPSGAQADVATREGDSGSWVRFAGEVIAVIVVAEERSNVTSAVPAHDIFFSISKHRIQSMFVEGREYRSAAVAVKAPHNLVLDARSEDKVPHDNILVEIDQLPLSGLQHQEALPWGLRGSGYASFKIARFWLTDTRKTQTALQFSY